VQQLGNANPRGIFQTLVYGFDGIQTRVPRYVGLICVSRASGRYSTVSGHMSEAELAQLATVTSVLLCNKHP